MKINLWWTWALKNILLNLHWRMKSEEIMSNEDRQSVDRQFEVIAAFQSSGASMTNGSWPDGEKPMGLGYYERYMDTQYPGWRTNRTLLGKMFTI